MLIFAEGRTFGGINSIIVVTNLKKQVKNIFATLQHFATTERRNVGRMTSKNGRYQFPGNQ